MNSPSEYPTGASRSCQVSESRPVAPVGGGSVCAAVPPPAGPVGPPTVGRTASRFDHRLRGHRRSARLPKRRLADSARRILCPRVGTIWLSAHFLGAGSACGRSTQNVPPMTIGRGYLRLAEAGLSPSLSPVEFCSRHSSWTFHFHLPASLGSTGVTPLPRYYGRSDSRRAALRALWP
jgi:hypothetical protein